MISPNLERISNYFGFGGTTAELGVLTSTFTILSGISILFFGYLADKITRKGIVLFGALFYSVFSILTILVQPNFNGYILFFIFTSLNGIGFGAIIPSIFSLLGDLVSKDNRSTGFSFFSVASLFGMALGLIIATLTGPVDWRFSYLIVGILGLINALFIVLFKEPSRAGKDHSLLLEKDGIEYTYRINPSELKVIFQKKSNVWLIVNFVDTIPTGIILFLIFYYMKDYHNVSEDVSLVFLGTILLSTLLGTLIFGYVGDKLFRKGNKRARALLALMGNIAPIPLLFIALVIPFMAPPGVSIGELFVIPSALIMLVLMMLGMFFNGAVNGNWFANIVDLNLPEHRATTLATANFFDVIGRSLGPLIGAFMMDAFNSLIGMMMSIVAWIFLPFFWIPVLKNMIPEIESTEKIFAERLKDLMITKP